MRAWWCLSRDAVSDHELNERSRPPRFSEFVAGTGPISPRAGESGCTPLGGGVFVAMPENESTTVAGFYTLSAGSVVLSDFPETVVKKLPRYPVAPVARLGRLAVDRRFEGQQLGRALLWDAAQRALAFSVAAFALVVDAKDERAAAFYRHHGFIDFGLTALQLFLPPASLKNVPPGPGQGSA
jgi:GNAT superfamily N-acetyltransferase